MQGNAGEPLRVFWSYAHKDESLREELQEHLAGLRLAGLISDWHDRKIGAGKVWKEEIDRHLADADLVLLLISASFMASEYCWGDEMAKAITRHEKDEARVIPVILRPCDWKETPIAKLQAAPKNAYPITQWPDRDAAYLDVATAIRGAVTELNALRGAAPKPPPVTQPVPPRALRPKQEPKDGVYIGVDPRELPDLAVFKDDDLPWLPEMVVIPAGTFLMGSPTGEDGRDDDEGPQHRVTIDTRVAFGKYALTFGEFDHFCEVTQREKPDDRGWSRGRRPVINVSWRDAQAYVAWLVGDTGRPYRLPTEAEWEYACRAGTTTPFSFGATVTPARANYNGNSRYGGGAKGIYRQQTVPVGSLPASPWGLHEMHGNVWEWVEDVWHDNYHGAPADGSAWTDGEGVNSKSKHVYRGGSWVDNPRDCRSACRDRYGRGGRYNGLGFRLARTLS